MTKTRIFVLYLIWSLLGFLLAPAPALAASEPNTAPSPGVITIPDLYLTFLVATLLPVLVGLVRSRYGSSRLGAMLLLFFSVVSGWLTSLYSTGGDFEPKTAFVSIVMSFITATGAHYGFLKPSGITGRDGAVERAVPGGVGS